MGLWDAVSDMDYYDEQMRFVPSPERDEYFEMLADVTRQELARLQREAAAREDEEESEPPF